MTSLKDFGYEDVKVIGRGQYGKAHLVRNQEKQCFIAKTIDLTCLSSKEHETARQEVALLRRLNHPNIVEYKDNFFMGDTLVIIMQYCEGGDLASYIKEMFRQKMRIHERQIMNYFVQVLQALEYIHNERILHRDLKTSNLFLMKSMSVVKLGDFGISRVLEGSIEAAVTVVGTPYYMSPEVCENKPYTFKSDVWSLGCVLYELCMLKHAFSADNLLGLVYKIVSDKYEPIPKLYSKELNALIQRMLEKSAEKRPSVRELLEDGYVHSFMNEYVQTRGQCATPAPTGGSRSAGAGSRSGASARGATAETAELAPSGTPGAASSSAARPRDTATAGDGAAAAPPAAEGRRGAGRAPGRQPRRPSGAGGAGGAARRPPPADGEHGRTKETPMEALRRRKREAADRQAAELQAAAKQSHKDKAIAKQLKDAEFKTTRNKSYVPHSPGGTPATTAPSTGIPEEGEPLDEDGERDDDYDDSYDEDSYEDDFEDDDFCSEEEGAEDEDDFEQEVDGGSGALRVEQEDVRRVMSNFEQGLARATSGTVSPPKRSSIATQDRPLKPAAASGPEQPGFMDMRARATRLKEELTRKMGEELFQQAFDFILDHRSRNKNFLRRDLEAVVGKEYYSYCFEIDQLVFQQLNYS
mmetsp:Transcript_56772/g.176543  ORF Transcript_56772/g.176543 Transcript_56772/m.176543 type:complete len:640 (+) Transcript_56772:214-2133(+)